MDPTYFLKNFDIFGKDENDNKLEKIEETNIFPNGDWIIDISHYDGAYISYNNERYIKIYFNNDESRIYMFLNADDYRIYSLSIRQMS